LAHELAHVAQQKGAADPGPDLAIGDSSDVAERDADAAAERALQGRGQTPLRAVEAMATLRRTTVPSWAGTFDNDLKYEPFVLHGTGRDKGNGNYGANATIRFTPTPKGVAQADQVALVQTVRSIREGNPVPDETAKDRSTPGGTHIDQPSAFARTPLAGMKDPPATSNDLAASEPVHSQFANRPPKGDTADVIVDTKPNQAVLVDTPRLPVADSESASQTFETAALAVSGPRKGVYYGAVTWGWDKKAGETDVKLKDLKEVYSVAASPQYDAPSAEFGKASERWNQSKTDQNQRLTLPIVSGMFVAHSGTKLMADSGKAITSLDLHTRVEITGQTDPTHPDWVKVIVTDGPQVGMQGWVEKGHLSDFKVKKSQ
jgi:hypothetical protein